MKTLYPVLLLLIGALSFNTVAAQSDGGSAKPKQMPQVFKIGEYEKDYDKLLMNHQAQLLNVCNNDMQEAFRKWMGMAAEIEAYAQTVDYNIDGLKFWVHVFWKKDGEIDKLGFHLRPNSRHVPDEELAEFLTAFVEQYRLPISANERFSHYTTLTFPMSYMLEDKQ